MSTAGQCRSAADTLVSICVRADCYVRCDGDETQKSKKPALKAGFSKFGSSDWTRTSSTSPVITAFDKLSHIFTNIFTIIIVFLW